VFGFVLGGTPARAALPGLQLGFFDDDSFINADPATNAVNLKHAGTAGANTVRFFLRWDRAMPTKPTSLAEAEDPGWPGYEWAATDQAFRQIVAAGMRPVPVPFVAPRWAEAAGRPAVSQVAPEGTWKPSARWYGAFATALARRYSGTYPDPSNAGSWLPIVRDWEVWNEPNLTNYLTPQWRKTARGYQPQSPGTFRALLNAFYKAVKAVSAKNFVISGGTAPFGDQRDGDKRMMPARFWRSLVCVSGRAHPKAQRCGKTVSFDAIAHHPYPIGPPRRRALNSDDVVVPDLAKITKPVAVAQRAGVVRPNRHKQLWVTEISWDSRPDPDGLTLAEQATYLEGALYVMWSQGVDVVTWYLLRDQAPTPSFATTYQSGIFERGLQPSADTPKPSFTAFAFPFTAYRSSGVATLWGMAPSALGATGVTVESRSGTVWRSVARLRSGSNRVFRGRLRVGPGTELRARAGDQTSLTWRVF
jgi:hypothetical protein